MDLAKIGDMSSCGATITIGADWFEIEDSPAAMNGSKTSCGGQIITGSSETTGSPRSIEIVGFRSQQSLAEPSASTAGEAPLDSATETSSAPLRKRPANTATCWTQHLLLLRKPLI